MNISTRAARLIFLIGVVLGVFWLFDWWPLLRGPQQWRWTLAPLSPTGRLLLFAASAVLFVAGWWYLGRKITKFTAKRRIFWSLAALFLLALLVQVALLALVRPNPLAIQFERLASNQASGYFTVAQEIEHLPSFLRHFPELMPEFTPDPHPRSKPPGIILLYWGVERLITPFPALTHSLGNWARGVRCGDLWLASLPDSALAANTLMGILTPLFSALAIGVAFLLVAVWRGPRAGWLAAGLVALLPGRLLFTPHLDTVYPFLTLLALLLVEIGWRRQRPWLSFLAGLVLSLATFFSLVNGLSAVVVGLYLLLRAIFSGNSFRDRLYPLWPQAAALVGGTLALWLVYWLASGVTPWAIYLAAAPARHDLARNYWIWLVGNIYDLAVFVSLPVFLLALPRRSSLSVEARRNTPWLPALLAAFWLTLLLLVVSGVIRGEVGRIWLMLAPLPPILAASQWVDSRSVVGKVPFSLGLVGLTAALLVVMGARWEVTLLEWPAPEQREVLMMPPPMDFTKTAVFGEDIQLLGYDLQQDVGRLNLTLYWQALARPDRPYTVFVHLLDEKGQLVAQADGMPQNGRLPATCWQSGEIVPDLHEIVLPEAAGEYDLFVGLYNAQDGVRLPVDAPDDALWLTAVTVQP